MASASPLRRLRGMHRAWSLLAVAFAALFILGGARNSIGVLYTPMVEDFGGERFGLSGAIAVGQVMLGVGYVAAGLAMDRFGPQRVIPVFALLHLAGNLLVARAEQLWEIYLGWGFLSALAFGVGVGPVSGDRDPLVPTPPRPCAGHHRFGGAVGSRDTCPPSLTDGRGAGLAMGVRLLGYRAVRGVAARGGLRSG